MKIKTFYIPLIALLFSNSCYAKILNAIDINPFFTFSAPFTQLKEVEYSFNYTLAAADNSGSGGGGMVDPPALRTGASDSNNLPNKLEINKSFNPYGYKVGFIVNNFLAIGYNFSSASKSKDSNLTDSIMHSEFSSELSKEQHGFSSHGIELMLIKNINDNTSLYLTSGVNKERYESSYNLTNSTNIYKNQYQLNGMLYSFGIGANILVRKSNYINIVTKIQKGQLKGNFSSFTKINTTGLEQTYYSDISSDSFQSYSIEVNYTIALKSASEIEKIMHKAL